jgi:hypothetical protein
MQNPKIDVSPEGITSLTGIIEENFGVREPIESVHSVTGGGVNDQSHRVVRTRSGRLFGIKTKLRGGGPQGEEREEAFSVACRALGVHEACKAVCVEGIRGLDGFEGGASVVTEWAPRSKRVSELSAEDRESALLGIGETMRQVGRWLAVDLHLGLRDRAKLDNWVWCATTGQLVAVDTESAFGVGSVQEHYSVIDAFYDRRRLRAERGASTAAVGFERGVREAHAGARANPAAITRAADQVESIRDYASPYANVDDDEFVDRVFSALA